MNRKTMRTDLAFEDGMEWDKMGSNRIEKDGWMDGLDWFGVYVHSIERCMCTVHGHVHGSTGMYSAREGENVHATPLL